MPMILLGKLPKQFSLACSGGSDSMVALDFFLNGRYRPTLIYFDHGTEHGAVAKEFVTAKAKEFGLELKLGFIADNRRSGKSIEEFWRDERYNFFNSIDGPIITAHHLNDAAEWWLFSSLAGNPKLIPYSRNNVIRPFLMVSKEEIDSWASRKGVEYLKDPGNEDEKYMRSIIRHTMMPTVLKVNPGFLTVIRKKYDKQL